MDTMSFTVEVLGLFGTNPTLCGMIDLTDQHKTVIPVSITTSGQRASRVTALATLSDPSAEEPEEYAAPDHGDREADETEP